MNHPYARRALLYSLLLALSPLLSCRSLPPPKPLSQLTPQQSHGHEVFQARCAQCHYDRTDGTFHGPSLLGVFQKPYLHSGAPATDARIAGTILHGRGLMPAVTALDPGNDPDGLNDLLAYLHTL